MAVFGTLETIVRQLGTTPALESALAHVRSCLTPGSDHHRRLMAMKPGDKGQVDLDHGAFAMEACSLTKPSGEGRWESHKSYIDVQAVVSGEEIMEVADVGALALAEDLTPAKDLVFYHPPARHARLLAGAGFVAVFHPEDGHRPSQSVDSPTPVCKVVVKVPV